VGAGAGAGAGSGSPGVYCDTPEGSWLSLGGGAGVSTPAAMGSGVSMDSLTPVSVGAFAADAAAAAASASGFDNEFCDDDTAGSVSKPAARNRQIGETDVDTRGEFKVAKRWRGREVERPRDKKVVEEVKEEKEEKEGEEEEEEEVEEEEEEEEDGEEEEEEGPMTATLDSDTGAVAAQLREARSTCDRQAVELADARRRLSEAEDALEEAATLTQDTMAAAEEAGLICGA